MSVSAAQVYIRLSAPRKYTCLSAPRKYAYTQNYKMHEYIYTRYVHKLHTECTHGNPKRFGSYYSKTFFDHTQLQSMNKILIANKNSNLHNCRYFLASNLWLVLAHTHTEKRSIEFDVRKFISRFNPVGRFSKSDSEIQIIYKKILRTCQ